MKSTLIVVTDLNEMKAYRLDNNPLHSTPRLELVEQFQTAGSRKLVDEVTDQAGRFPGATLGSSRTGAMSQGERHNIELEKRKRCVRRIAGQVNSLLNDPTLDRCFMAASREINNVLLEEIDPRARAKIEINIPSDLTDVSKSDLLSHFRAATRAGAVA